MKTAKEIKNPFLYGRYHRFEFLKMRKLENEVIKLFDHLMDRKWKKVLHINSMIDLPSKMA